MSELLPGTEVEARGLRWEVVFAERLGPQVLYRLRGLEKGALWVKKWTYYTPSSHSGALCMTSSRTRPRRCATGSCTIKSSYWNRRWERMPCWPVQPGRLRLDPYQLVPVLRAIRMRRPRLLLADGVGLGKTVQAGLVLTELMARRRGLAYRHSKRPFRPRAGAAEPVTSAGELWTAHQREDAGRMAPGSLG
jgi:hypothetical protein